jgi:hypothetical protein
MPYRITIYPDMLTEGGHKGHVEHVEFLAQSETGETVHWWETNFGQLPESFRRLVQPAIADNLVAILRTGD